LRQTEYRLGAIRYITADYLEMTGPRASEKIRWFEYWADQQLVNQIPTAVELLDKPAIVALRAQHPD
jgi:hypothetical protein